jgi:hypothetical protein
MKIQYYEVRYISINGKDKTAHISARSQSDAIKKIKVKPLFWDMDKVIYPIITG